MICTTLTCVSTEYLDAWEGRYDPDPEADHVRDGGDGDGDCGVPEALSHALVHGRLGGGATPRAQHHECVVNANTCEIMNERLRE